MSIFSEVRLKWGDREYVIPAEDMMRCIAKVEDVITLAELYAFQQRETLPLAKLSLAYATMLQQAGAENITADKVYTAMFSNAPGVDKRALAVRAVRQLLVLMIPPEHLNKPPAEAEASAGKEEAGAPH